MKTYKLGDIRITVKVVPDEDPDLSHLGEYTDKRAGIVVDRATGRLLADESDIHIYQDDEKYTASVNALYEKYDAQMAKYYSAKTDRTARTWKKRADATYEAIMAEEERVNALYDADLRAAETLREAGHRVYVDDRSCRYWRPGENHIPHNPHNWDHVQGDDLARVIAEYGSVEQADYAYALEDWARMEAYERGDWHMVGVVATVYIDGKEVAESSVWGIESDSGEDYLDEVGRDMIFEALTEARNSANRYKSIAANLATLPESTAFIERADKHGDLDE